MGNASRKADSFDDTLNIFSGLSRRQWLFILITLATGQVLLALAIGFLYLRALLGPSEQSGALIQETMQVGESESTVTLDAPISTSQPQAKSRWLELNYPTVISLRDSQPVRINATLLQDGEPISDVQISFLPNEEPPVNFSNSVSNTNIDGLAWAEFIPTEELAGRMLYFTVRTGELVRNASIYVAVDAPGEQPAAITSEDVDGDGLTATQEQILQTNPELPDSDGDGVNDGEEFFVFHTSPRSSNIRYLDSPNKYFRSIYDTTQAGILITNTVQLFDVGKTQKSYLLILVNAKIRKDAVTFETESADEIDPFYPPWGAMAIKGAQLFDPLRDGEVVWLELSTPLPVILVEDVNELYYLVRIFGYIEPTLLR